MVSGRVAARVREQFADAEPVLALLDGLRLPFIDDDPVGRERVQAAVVLAAQGDPQWVLEQAVLAERDWRDVLVNAGLANAGWESVLDAEFGVG